MDALVSSTNAQVAYTAVPAVMRDSGQLAPAHPTPHVTLTVHDSTIKYVIRELARQAHLHAVDNNNPVLAKRITVNIVDQNVIDALTTALRGTGLIAVMASDGETVVIRERTHTQGVDMPSPDSGVIRGRVTDSASTDGVRGATVVVQGTKLSVLTSSDGRFELRNIPAGEQMLAVKLFGYWPAEQQVAVTGGSPVAVRVVLNPVATMLSGVVTTATGQQQKLAVGSDITTINVDSVMKTAPINTVTDLLENRVPGLTVVHTSGVPGNPSRLLLRGASSVSGSNNPIVVIDGVRAYYPQNLNRPGFAGQQADADNGFETAQPSPLDQVDPHSIETIEVLKGPSASALYGSDAANGVIVITTKHGQAGRTHWSIHVDGGLEYLPGGFPSLVSEYGHEWSLQDIGLARSFNSNNSTFNKCVGGLVGLGFGQDQNYSPCLIDSIRVGNVFSSPRFTPLTTGNQSSASATVSGGDQALTYSFTGSGSNTHGTTKLPAFIAQQYTVLVGAAPPSWMTHPDAYSTWSGSGHLSATLSPVATVSVQDQLTSSTQHRTNLSTSTAYSFLGVYIDTTNPFNTPNLLGFLNQITDAQLTNTTAGILQWRIRPWLPLMLTAGLNRNEQTLTEYVPSGLPMTVLGDRKYDSAGFYGLASTQATVATLNAQTTIPLSLWQGRRLTLALGTNFVNNTNTQQILSTSILPVGVSVPTTFPQTTATSVSQTSQSAATYGWFVEPQLQLHSRFYITPGIRLDGGTASGSSAGLIAFPKTNFSYIAVDHSSTSDQRGWSSMVSLLRLRGAFGIAGVQPTPGQNLRLFSAPESGTLDGGTTTTSEIILHTLGNTTLHPERSRELEGGFDVQLFQNRATFTATYYNKLRIEAIEAVSVAPSVAGAYGSQTYLNVGNIRNTGLELSGTAQLIDQGPVVWSVQGQWSDNANKVLSTSANYAAYCALNYYAGKGSSPCVRAGYPLGATFAPRIAGYADVNGDGLIEGNEIVFSDSSVYVGQGDPPYTASFSTTVSLWHGRLSLATQGSWQSGMAVANGTSMKLLGSAANASAASQLAQVVTTGYLEASGVGIANTVQTVTMVRWDALSVTYTLPNTVTRFFHGQQATLALQGSNLALLTNYVGKDPAVNTDGNGLGISDMGNLPLPRMWRLAVQVAK